MNNKLKLIVFGSSAIVLIGLVGLLDIDADRRVETPLLYPDLKVQVNDIDSLKIKSMDGITISLHKTDDSVWRLTEAGDYPASVTRLRNLVLALTELRAVEEKTSNAKYYERLGVSDLDKARSVTKLISLYQGDAAVVELIVGKAAASGHHYVRKLNETQSWLGSEVLDSPLEQSAWLNNSLLDIAMDRIQSVSVQPVKGQSFEFSRATKEDEYKLLNSKPQALDAAQLVPLLSAIQGLQFEELAKADDVALLGNAWNTIKYVTFDGLTIELRNQSKDNDLYLQLSIQHNASEQAKTSENIDVSAESVAELQRRFNGRTFILAAYLQTRLNPELEKLRAKAAAN